MNKKRLLMIISGVLCIAYVTTFNYGGCLGNTNTTNSGSSSAPIVNTTSATNVNYNSATLNGTVNPNGFDTTCYFYWESAGLATINGTTTPQNIGDGITTVNVSANITPLYLQMGIGEYGYRIVAGNSSGTSYGEFQSFNILP
ncbi:MAG: hypothetical protein V1871_06955 [Planctomycetota bacterium]